MMMMMMMMMMIMFPTFNTQVTKLRVARWKPWSWTCAFVPQNTMCFDVQTRRWRQRRQTEEGFELKVTMVYKPTNISGGTASYIYIYTYVMYNIKYTYIYIYIICIINITCVELYICVYCVWYSICSVSVIAYIMIIVFVLMHMLCISDIVPICIVLTSSCVNSIIQCMYIR